MVIEAEYPGLNGRPPQVEGMTIMLRKIVLGFAAAAALGASALVPTAASAGGVSIGFGGFGVGFHGHQRLLLARRSRGRRPDLLLEEGQGVQSGSRSGLVLDEEENLLLSSIEAPFGGAFFFLMHQFQASLFLYFC